MTLAAAIVLSAISVAYSFTFLQFATSNRALLPQGKRYIERYVEFDREFGQLDDLLLAVQAPSLPEATIYANRLVRELRANRVPLAHLTYRIDPKQFEGRALLYLSADRLKEIRERVFDYQQFMEKFADRPTLDQLVDGIATSIAQAFVTGLLDLGLDSSAGASKGSLDLRFVHDVVTQIAGRLDRPTPYRSPWGGHLSLFSVMFIPIVIGIGIDYGIYYLFRYEEELFLGRNLREAIEITAMRSGPGILLSAITAAATFFVLMLTDFRGLQELGFIAGTALLLSWVSMMFLFPAMLMHVDRRHLDRVGVSIPRAIRLERVHVPFVDWITSHPKTVLAAAALLAAVSVYGFSQVRFDFNLLNLQAEGTESVAWEKKILATSGRSGFAALSSASSLDELRRKQHAFRALGSVSEVDSALLLIPDDQPEKQKIIRDFAPIVAPVRVARPQPVDIDRLLSALETLKRRFDIASGEAPPGDTQRRLASLRDDIAQLVVRLRQSDRTVSEPALAFLQRQVYRDFVTSFQRLQANLNPRTVGLADVPPEIRRKFISDRGSFLLQIHPAVDIWDRDGAARFVNDLRSVDGDVTGTPIITYEAIRLMERAYKQGTVYAIVLVTVLTFLMLRRIRETVLALSPLALGMTWTAGLMWLFDVKLNLGNVLGIPLILGAAAESGLHIVMRFMEGRDHGGPLVARSTIMAVFVNGLTTMVGFGSLMLAAHRGIYGLGLMLTLGMLASLVSALIVLPVLLRLFGGKPQRLPRDTRAAETIAPAPAS